MCDRNGIYEAECRGYGTVMVKISDGKYGEKIELWKDRKRLAWLDTAEDRNFYNEDDGEIRIFSYAVKKPLRPWKKKW